MVASRDGRAVAVQRATNAVASPLPLRDRRHEQYWIQTAIEDAGLELGAIYYSHTPPAPTPSQTDINLAFYPEAIYVIVGSRRPDVRAWRIVDGAVSETALEVEDGVDSRRRHAAGVPRVRRRFAGGEERLCPDCGVPLVLRPAPATASGR